MPDSSKSVAESRDERIHASIESVAFGNGPGACVPWDEYLIRIRATSVEPVEIREIVIFNEFDQRIEPRAAIDELAGSLGGSRDRYDPSGNVAWIYGNQAPKGCELAREFRVPAALMGHLLTLPLGIASSIAVEAAMREPVNSEIKRRATKFPVALPRGTEARVDLFFPRTPRSGQTRVVYTDLHGEHRLDIDTRDALVELDQTPFTTLVSRSDPEFPDEARRAGITHGYAKADLTLDRQGRVRSVDVFESIPRHYFDEEARRTLQRWTYREGRDGRVVRVTLEFKR